MTIAAADAIGEILGLTRETVCADANRLFCTVCEHGNLATARWLTHTFGLTVRDAMSRYGEPLRCACERGDLGLVAWLVEEFALGVHDVLALDRIALDLACANGHHDVVCWLLRTFGLRPVHRKPATWATMVLWLGDGYSAGDTGDSTSNNALLVVKRHLRIRKLMRLEVELSLARARSALAAESSLIKSPLRDWGGNYRWGQGLPRIKLARIVPRPRGGQSAGRRSIFSWREWIEV